MSKVSKAPKPDPVIVYGRARRLANRYVFGISQQLNRIKETDAENDFSYYHLKNDWEVLIIFLFRLQRCVKYLSSCSEYENLSKNELAQFQRELPDLHLIRNFEEHFDEYSLGKGRNKIVDWGHLETFYYGASEFSYGIGTLQWENAKAASESVWTFVLGLEGIAKQLGYWDREARMRGSLSSEETK